MSKLLDKFYDDFKRIDNLVKSTTEIIKQKEEAAKKNQISGRVILVFQ